MRTLIAQSALESRTDELASEINATYGEEPVVLLCVLKGAYIFAADLARRLTCPVVVDFIQVSSYGDSTVSSGVVRLKRDHDVNIEGKHTLVVEDIVDSGLTLEHLLAMLRTRRPRSLRTVAMLSKARARGFEAPLDWVGFEIDNQFVVGYGLDHAENYRNLPFIGLMED
ncbi:MAG: hypoxanthine phosphoribosyltransferase [Fimbriimonadaceae bacterium]